MNQYRMSLVALVVVSLMSASVWAEGRDKKQGDTAAQAKGQQADQDSVEALQMMHRANQKEVALASMARDKAETREVKQYAKMLEREHQKANRKVEMAAEKLGVNLDSNQVDVPAELESSTGIEFDKKFVAMQIDDHQKDIESLEEMKPRVTNKRVKKVITQTMPHLKKHLARAKQLDKQLARRS